MKEIKFRAWNTDEMVYSDVLGWSCWGDCWMDDESLMQYTGLKDKNGVDIYEGDYLKIIGATINEESFEGEVIFQDGTFGLKSKTQPKPESYTEMVRFWNDGSHDHHSLEMIQSFEIEVIGNIQENPELCQK